MSNKYSQPNYRRTQNWVISVILLLFSRNISSHTLSDTNFFPAEKSIAQKTDFLAWLRNRCEIASTGFGLQENGLSGKSAPAPNR
jgi:hypothetical protein